MKRRCAFLDKTPAFNYNIGYGECYVPETGAESIKSDTRELGSTMMDTMLREVKEFCDLHFKHNWSQKPHQQVNRLVQCMHYCEHSGMECAHCVFMRAVRNCFYVCFELRRTLRYGDNAGENVENRKIRAIETTR